MILDEATNSLDKEKEIEILENLKSSTGKTIIFVTHNTFLLSKLNKVIYFEDGILKKKTKYQYNYKIMINNKTILITGGTGSFGSVFIEHLLKNYNPKKIIIFSRDEQKHFLMEKNYQNIEKN